MKREELWSLRGNLNKYNLLTEKQKEIVRDGLLNKVRDTIHIRLTEDALITLTFEEFCAYILDIAGTIQQDELEKLFLFVEYKCTLEPKHIEVLLEKLKHAPSYKPRFSKHDVDTMSHKELGSLFANEGAIGPEHRLYVRKRMADIAHQDLAGSTKTDQAESQGNDEHSALEQILNTHDHRSESTKLLDKLLRLPSDTESQEQYNRRMVDEAFNSPMYNDRDGNMIASAYAGNGIHMDTAALHLNLEPASFQNSILNTSDQKWSADLDDFFPEPLQPFSF